MDEQQRTVVDTPGRTYSSAEVAAFLGVTRQTVHQWVALGKLPAFDIGGPGRARIRITQHVLDAFVATNKLDVSRLITRPAYGGTK